MIHNKPNQVIINWVCPSYQARGMRNKFVVKDFFMIRRTEKRNEPISPILPLKDSEAYSILSRRPAWLQFLLLKVLFFQLPERYN